MSNTTSTPNQIRIWLSQNPGFHKTADIADALGLERKAASSALSRLFKADRVVREDGAYSDPNATEMPPEEPVEEETLDDEDRELPDGWDTVKGEAPAEEPASAEANGVDEPVKKFDFEAMKSKISKLLAKAEGTDNEKERDTFNAKAEKLMLQLGIQRAELEAAGEVDTEDIVEVHRDWRGNYSIVMVPFVHDVAQGFGNLTILQSTASAMLRRTYIIGHKSDVERFTQLIDSLALQVLSALRRWQKEHADERRHLTDMQKYIQHRSFIAGFGQEVRKRLTKEVKQVLKEEQVSAGAELVLASKMDRVNAWIDEAYPDKGKARGGIQRHSAIALQHGREAGAKANLGGKSVGGKKGELKS